ncbi:MAG: GAF domain-containing protein [Anaerolineales bacterium]|nr:GAF domain-containing protein [Anaerolineales bacterium]
MSKKPKIDKRLDKLFKGIIPEESDSKSRDNLNVRKEAPLPPADSLSASVQRLIPASQKAETVSSPKPLKHHAPALITPESAIITQENESAASSYSINIQTGYQDWSTLRVFDETNQRQWTPDEELLVKQVSDQLALALENARLFQETQKRAQEMAIVNSIVTSVAGTLDLKSTLQSIADNLANLLSAGHVGITLMNEDKTALILTADAPALPDAASEIGISLPISGNPVTEEVIRTRKPLFIQDVPNNPLMLPIRDLMLRRGTQNLFIMPLIANEEVIGTIGIDFFEPERIMTEEEIHLLETIVYQTATAVQKARLFQEINQLNQAIQSSNASIVTTDLNGKITQVNPGFTIMSGYTAEEVIGKTPSLLKSGLHSKELYQQMWKTILAGEIWHSELINKRKDGTLYTVEQTILPVHDNEGKLTGFLATENDITEKKKDQEALARSEADLRALFKSMEDIVLVYDQDGRYLRIAPTNPARLIKPPEELLGQLIHEVFPKETADRFLSAINKTLDSGENSQLEYELVVGNETYWFLANLSKLNEGNVFWVARDITERKKAEEAIRRRNEYLAVSAEIGKLVTSTLDLNSIFARTVNLINERFNFYHAGIFIVEETGFNAVCREATGLAGAEMKERRHTLQLNEKSIVGKVTLDGQAVIVNDVTANPLHKVNPLLPETRAEAALPLRIGNRIIGAIDIQSKTAGSFTEDDVAVLQTLADQVAVAIDNARSFELSQEAVMEMREIDRLKSQFLANMSHELRTPLNSIIGFSRVIIKGIDGPVTELQQQDLTAIYNSGQHLLGLINDVLDLSKIEAGKMELAFDEVNMADVTSSVLSTMSGLIKDKPIQMKRIIEPNLPTVRADAIRVRQVMINLLSNASKFTDEGDILVEVGLKPGPTGRNELRVSVTDSGPGIAKQDQTKLFQAFSQVDDSPTRKTGGTGLGLSICQHIINMHGGRIWVDSDLGKGSTFHFTLPLFRKEKESVSISSGNKVILAIDDDPQVIGLYERYLHPQGYQVVPLSDPSRAVERVKQLKPFAVTLDIMMPGVDGWQVLDSLKGDPDTRNTPVIVCSIIEDLEKGFNLGATDYLVKPILEDDLVNALDRLNADGSIRDVLVIDDNPDDLRLIGKILTDDGRYKAILAEGGRMGWDIISSGKPPHAVILDLFMPEVDGFKILENMQASQKLRDIPVIVISGMDLSTEQKNQLNEFGQRLLSKGSFNEKELLTSIQRSLERVHTKNK